MGWRGKAITKSKSGLVSLAKDNPHPPSVILGRRHTRKDFTMAMNVVEKHFKDEADRNHRASLDAHRQIGELRAGKNYAEKEGKHFKAQFNTAFETLIAARGNFNKLASELADTHGSESTIGKQVDKMADRIESGIETLLARRWSL